MIKGCALPQVFLLFDFPPRQRRATYDARSSRACNRTKTPLLLRWRNLRGTALCSQGTHILLGDLFCRHECIWCVRACEGRSGGAGPYDQFLMPHCETSNARTFSVQTDYCSSSSQGRDKRGIAFLTGPAFGHTKASIQAASVGVYSIAG